MSNVIDDIPQEATAGSSSNTTKQKPREPKSPLRHQLSFLPTIPERVVLTLEIAKSEDEQYGLTIVGGLGSLSEHVYVKSMSPIGVCTRDGQLRLGDQLLEVNGVSVEDKSHEEVVDMFRCSMTKLGLLVSRLVESRVQNEQESPISPYHGHILARTPSSGLDEEPTVLEHKTLCRT